jgi:heterodisulfide reductase subunit C
VTKHQSGLPEACIQCGTCVTVCPVEMVGGHAIVSFLADPDTTDYSVWLCTSCWRCQEACPAGVDIYELMMERRRQEQAPAGYQASYESLLACGLALGIPQEELDQMRAAWGLEPVRLPPPGLARALLGDDE